MSDSSNPIEVLNSAINAAVQDPKFKTLLLTNAHAALKALGMQIPEEVAIKVEERNGIFTVILPEALTSTELSDAELDQVAGGIQTITCPPTGTGCTVNCVPHTQGANCITQNCNFQTAGCTAFNC